MDVILEPRNGNISSQARLPLSWTHVFTEEVQAGEGFALREQTFLPNNHTHMDPFYLCVGRMHFGKMKDHRQSKHNFQDSSPLLRLTCL